MEARIDWNKYTVLQMWDMVKHESMATGEQQAGAWRNTATVCDEQAARLETAAAQLAETWVPNPGTAAEMFQGWIGEFTASMRHAADTAERNASAITDITYQMSSTRDRLHNLVMKGYEYIYAEDHQYLPPEGPGQITPRPSGIPMPPSDWQETLHAQAKAIMSSTETTVIVQAMRVQRTPPFEPRGRVDTGVVTVADSRSAPLSISGSARLIDPPVFPTSMDLTGSVQDQSRDATADSLGAVLGRSVPASDRDRLVLDGVPSPPGQLSPPRFGPLSPFDPLGPLGPLGPGAGNPSVPVGPFGVPPSTIGTPIRPVAEVRSGTITGAVGARPGSTGVAGTSMAPMVPPVGMGRPGAAGSAAAGGRAGSRRRRATDPRDDWNLPQGGPAVIEPKEDPDYHDPGPGVIGIDR